ADRDHADEPIDEEARPLLERLIPRQREELAGADAVADLNLREDDPREDQHVRDARADPRPEAVQSHQRREPPRPSAVQDHRRRAAREDPDADGPPDLARRRALALGALPELAHLAPRPP